MRSGGSEMVGEDGLSGASSGIAAMELAAANSYGAGADSAGGASTDGAGGGTSSAADDVGAASVTFA